MKFLALEHHLQLQPRLVVSKNPLATTGRNIVLHYITLTLFSVDLTNSYSKITNKYQLKQKM